MNDGPNIPEGMLSARILADWQDGRISFIPEGESRDSFTEAVLELKEFLTVSIEFNVDPNGRLAVRANRGFALGIIPYTPEAKVWVANRPHWVAMQTQWNNMTLAGGC